MLICIYSLFFAGNVHRRSAMCNKIASNQAHHCCMSPAVWGYTVYHSKGTWEGCQYEVAIPLHPLSYLFLCFVYSSVDQSGSKNYADNYLSIYWLGHPSG